jgi:pentatricopeptide repeat protein
VRTYNTIISACNRSGQAEHALRVYERMLADGAQPTATTYTALISAYGKTGKASPQIPAQHHGSCLHAHEPSCAPSCGLFPSNDEHATNAIAQRSCHVAERTA